MTAACKGAGITREMAYVHKKAMPDFAAAWEDAKEAAIEILEAEAWQRARKQSDTLMIFLLKSYKPEKYKERTEVDLTSNGKPSDAIRRLKSNGVNSSTFGRRPERNILISGKSSSARRSTRDSLAAPYGCARKWRGARCSRK